MSSGASEATRKASMLVAASIGTVEALKDQVGLCRWNYAMRSLSRYALNGPSSLSSKDQAMVAASSNSALGKERRNGANGGGSLGEGNRSEEKLNKVYHLICWGPN